MPRNLSLNVPSCEMQDVDIGHEHTLTNQNDISIDIAGPVDSGERAGSGSSVGEVLGEVVDHSETGRGRQRARRLRLEVPVPNQSTTPVPAPVPIANPQPSTSTGVTFKSNLTSLLGEDSSKPVSNTNFISPKRLFQPRNWHWIQNPTIQRLYHYRPALTRFQWIPKNFTTSNMKSVIRSALTAWLSLILFVIPKVENVLGQASFLILIAAFLSPPCDPFIAVAERELIILFFVTTSYAWSCLGIKFSSLARSQIIMDTNSIDIFSGRYIEAGPTVISAIFLFIGSSFLLYIKARKGPGPFTFATVLGCITLDISLLIAPLYPYPFYLIGRQILLPITFHSALALLLSIFIFPESITSQFQKRLRAVFDKLHEGMSVLDNVFSGAIEDIASEDNFNNSDFNNNEISDKSDKSGAKQKKKPKSHIFDPTPFSTLISQTEAALAPLAASGRLIKLDITYSRFGPRDFKALQELARRMTIRANGMSFYFKIIDPTRERFPVISSAPVTPYSSVPATPVSPTPSGSRANSIVGSRSRAESIVSFKRNRSQNRENEKDRDEQPVLTPSIRIDSEFDDSAQYGRRHSRTSSRESNRHRNRRSVDNNRLSSLFMSLHRNRNRMEHEEGGDDEQSIGLEQEKVDEEDNHYHGSTHRRNHHHHHHIKIPHPFSHLHFQDTFSRSRSSPSSIFPSHHNIPSRPEPHQHARSHSYLQLTLSHLQSQLHLQSQTQMHEHPVGVFESQRYLNLESRFLTPSYNLSSSSTKAINTHLSQLFIDLVKNSTEELVREVVFGLDYVSVWFVKVEQDEKFHFTSSAFGFSFQWWNTKKKGEKERRKYRKWEEGVQKNEEVRRRVGDALKTFREVNRHIVLNPYRSVHDERKLKSQDHDQDQDHDQAPPPRYLFQSYVYQYHLLHFSFRLLDVIDEINRLEKHRRHKRLWLPQIPISEIFSLGDKWQPSEDVQRDDDEDPDIIPGIDPSFDFVGVAKRRDPDALPATNSFQLIAAKMYHSMKGVTRGNVVFALKAGIITVLLSLSSFLPNSAMFSYVNKSVWAVFMGQLTLSRFRGDTAFGLTSRILSTFLGGLIGLVIWYISSASGTGSPYGLVAVGAVVLPPFFFARLYWPGPPMTNIIFFVTIQLVVGYSWQDTHVPTLSSPGVGINVAWRRFALVAVGVTAAFIFSFLPPSTTLRRYIRTTHATTVAEIGELYCDVVSYASGYRDSGIRSSEEIGTALIAVRSKLTRVTQLRANVVYEFSFAGRWPLNRYIRLQEIQMEIAYLLSHLRSVVEHLDPAWARAFLQRTRFLEADFQGDVLAVISLISTSLRAGVPLPQVTPCPLLDRFILEKDTLNIWRGDTEDDYGLPRTLTIDTLENEQYLFFSVGVATAFGIVTRLDRLMVATKELVGETYHIHGIHGPRSHKNVRLDPPTPASLDPDLPSKEV